MKTFIRTQNSLRAAAALLLAIFFAAGFTACSNEDNSVNTFTPELVVGKWYYEQRSTAPTVKATMPSSLTKSFSTAT